MSDTPDKARILVVEDERHLATGLKLNLELEGYEAVLAGTAREAGVQLVGPRSFDVILLDVMLPDTDGFTFCRRLREAGNYTPVIMLTARGSAEDRVTGLEVGADDYLVKPFALSELIARVRSALRRRTWERGAQSARPSAMLEFGDARIDFDTHEVLVRERSIELTQLELDLVRYFADHAGRVIPRAELIEKVWKLGNYPNTRTVDNFILRLRRHFEVDPASPQHFLSVRGSGYKFVPAPAAKKT